MSATPTKKLAKGDMVTVVTSVGAYGVPSAGKMKIVEVKGTQLKMLQIPEEPGFPARWYATEGHTKIRCRNGWFEVSKP